MIRRTWRYYRQLSTEVPGLRAVTATRPEQLRAAKELHARSYRALGIVAEADLTSDGLQISLAEDPHQAHSVYFSVLSDAGDGDRTVAGARIIYARPGEGLGSFPTYVHQDLYPAVRRQLEALDPADCGEISALVREPGVSGKATLMLYRSIWHYSLDQGYARLLVSCDARLYRRCKMIFGDAWQRAGPAGYSRNVLVVPVMIDIPGSLDEALRLSRVNLVKRRVKRKALEFFLRGLPGKAVRPAQRTVIDRYRLDTSARV